MRPGTLQLRGAAAAVAVRPPAVVPAEVPVLRLQLARDRSAATLPEQRYLDALRADLEASLPLVWGREGAQRLHRRRHAEPVLAGSASTACSPTSARALPLAPDCEITLEANPGTFEKRALRGFRAAGVTRLSIGVQSFDDAHLKALGRVHDARAGASPRSKRRATRFDNFNLDLMYALPGQTLARARAPTSTQALALAPPHLSIYHLTIEPNTLFAKYPPALPDDDLASAMLDRITEMHGAARASSTTRCRRMRKPGHRCRHNLNYWQFGDYLGIGAGAHGKLSFPHRVVRQVRYREPRLYMDNGAGRATRSRRTTRSRARDLPFEFMLNALRLREGFALAGFRRAHGLAADGDRAAAAGGRGEGPDRARLRAREADRARLRFPVAICSRCFSPDGERWGSATATLRGKPRGHCVGVRGWW